MKIYFKPSKKKIKLRIDKTTQLTNYILMNKSLLFFAFFTQILSVFGQVNHWETAIFANDNWYYFVGTSQPTDGWTEINYSQTNWQTAKGGFGFGDEDDGTVIETVSSVFLRKKFTITDISKLSQAILHADFDDGFIAYINGVEIARYHMTGNLPAFDTPSSDLHEATLYQGLTPERFSISKEKINQIMKQGENVLAIQVHNNNATSSDLSSNFFLSFGISDHNVFYSPTPSWFSEESAFSTHLPIIKINTNGQTIVKEYRIIAQMAVINYTDHLNSSEDTPNEYNSRISIRVRGSSSSGFPKKGYSLETQDSYGENLNISLLGLPKENDWVLHGPYSDKSLLRNVLAYQIANNLGSYATRTRFAEVFLNEQYIGVYVFEEKIKPDDNRVNIDEMTPFDNSGVELTGGYILKFDRNEGDVDSWETSGWNRVRLVYDYPDAELITQQQKAYIQNVILNFETNLKSTYFNHPTEGYSRYIDPESFMDFLFVNEISKNVDGYRLSSYLYKEKDSEGGKIHMGPVWDFNLGFGNADYFDSESTTGFSYLLNAYAAPFWWERLLSDEKFVNDMKCRWQDFRQSELNTDTLLHFIDNKVLELGSAIQRNFDKWKILNTYIWPNEYIGGTHENEINYLKQWLTTRMNWLDENLPGTCNTNSVAEINKRNGLLVFPNPFTEILYLRFVSNQKAEYEFRITNSLGQIVFSEKQTVLAQTPVEFSWNAAQMNVYNGIYICQVFENEQLISSQKAVFNH